MISIDELIRSRRKTIAIIVEADGRLVVRVPLRVSQAEVLQVVERHSDWILKRQAQAQAARIQHPPHTYMPGDEFLYLGRPRRLEVVERKRPTVSLDGDVLTLSHLVQPMAVSVLRRWYRAQACRFIPERVLALANRYGFRPRGVRITSARTRWGSCSPTGKLCFTWRLMIAPLSVIEYVILHEMVHLEIKNHSAAFWQRLQGLVPDYKECVRWLKAHAAWGADL